jgi:spore germination protein GerM
MRRRPSPFSVLAVLVTLVAAWLLLIALPQWYGREQPEAQLPSEPAQQETGRRITATLFYISEDGMHLVGAQREVPHASSATEQARRIVEAALGPAPDPLASAVPEGTTLRALFLTPRGEAYVDLSEQVSAAHTGGSLDELFTVYAIVNALTVNLPAVTAVQILVNGSEVDTLAGHVDLRRPLGQNLTWTAPDQPAEPSEPAEPSRPDGAF